MPPRSVPKSSSEPTSMVGAILAVQYSEQMTALHQATGRTRKSLMKEALDNLFAAHADKIPGYGKTPKTRK